ncbi:regulatory protein RecX [Roseomonas marmotae]|uniref:Regulatory protein RecX n=1 Tax=Roseomonas marmotae TaxID=2768161 RepID=A0ABS3KCA8_9PROT|nr:RecX family transcriptional regulator [Roseomonas marmotae]MBO1075097.1 RecX family transcriptional regulator [Roseomonas marmotae]QTI79787.1 RecX family transcriptional regulator [Roseomonas marmotae]
METPPGKSPARPRRDIPAGPAPTAERLREAALAHLARFGTTEAGLRRVLQRRVDRWARRAEAEGQLAEVVAPAAARAKAAAAEVAQALARAGAVDDTAFAAARMRRLNQAGRSRRAIAAHLAAKGVPGETAASLLEEADELAAALGHLRRRRAGPFAIEQPPSPEARLKALGALARAGFSRDLAERALDMEPEAATDRLLAARRG